ncbi:hypothetical protein Hanom_Chr01g00083071 [Helianthus anomalus]
MADSVRYDLDLPDDLMNMLLIAAGHNIHEVEEDENGYRYYEVPADEYDSSHEYDDALRKLFNGDLYISSDDDDVNYRENGPSDDNYFDNDEISRKQISHICYVLLF